MRVDRKKKNKKQTKKKGDRKYLQGDPYIKFEQDWSVGLGTTLRDNRKLNTIFLVSRIFREKPMVSLLGFECTINPQNLKKIVRAIFEKIKILIFFFLCELPLILGVAPKGKKRQKIFARRLQVSNLNKIGQLVEVLF